MKYDIKEIATKGISALGNFLKRIWQWYKGLYKDAPWYKKILVAFVSLVAAFVFYLFAVNVNLFWLFGKSPSVNDIMHPETN